MPTRRSLLSACATGVASAAAGCTVFGGSSSDGGILGRQWFTAGMEEYLVEGDDGQQQLLPVTTTAPARGASIDSLPEIFFETSIYHADRGANEARAEEIEQSVNIPLGLTADVGRFSADAGRSILPESVVELDIDLDASGYVTGPSSEGIDKGYAIREGTAIELRPYRSREHLLGGLEAALAASTGDGDSVVGDGPLSRVFSFLDDGIICSIWKPGTQTPAGITFSVDGDTARRRTITLHEDEATAGANDLLDAAVQTELRQREFAGDEDGGEPIPLESLEVKRDGRAVTTTATLPTTELHYSDLNYFINRWM